MYTIQMLSKFLTAFYISVMQIKKKKQLSIRSVDATITTAPVCEDRRNSN